MTAMLAGAQSVLAQDEYDWEYTSETSGSDTLGAGFCGVMGIIYCCIFIFAIANFVIWLMSLIHVVQNAPDDKKTMWLLIVILVPFGAWVYFFTKRKEWSSK